LAETSGRRKGGLMSFSDGGDQDLRSPIQTEQPAPPTPIPEPVAQELKQRGLDPSEPQLRLAVTVAAKYYAGPLPTAAELGSYGQIDPGLPMQIIRWADGQRTHRMGLERLTTEGSEERMHVSQRNGLIVALASIVAATICGLAGFAIAAAAIAIAGIGGPSAATVIARYIDSIPPKR
jgi:uncharacterized membrane protein